MWWKILLIIFGLLFLFFCQSIHIIVRYEGEVTIIAGLGFIRLNVLKLLDKMKNKPKKEKEKKEKKEEKPKEETPKDKPPNVFQEVWQLRGVDGAIDLLSQFATLISKFGASLGKHFVIRKLFVRYSVSAKDSAQVAEKFGKINAVVFACLGKMSGACTLKHHDIVITPDFLGQKPTQKADIHVSYRLISLIAVALSALKDFMDIIKREKKINARIKARSRERALAREKQEYLEEMKEIQQQENQQVSK